MLLPGPAADTSVTGHLDSYSSERVNKGIVGNINEKHHLQSVFAKLV